MRPCGKSKVSLVSAQPFHQRIIQLWKGAGAGADPYCNHQGIFHPPIHHDETDRITNCGQDTLLSFFGHFRAVVFAKRYHLSYGDSRIYRTHPHKRFRSRSCFMTEVLQGHGRLRCFQHAGCSRGSDNVPQYSDYLSGALNQLSECRSPSSHNVSQL